MSCVMIIIVAVAVYLVSPILCFFGGWIAGAILEWAVGGLLASGLNLLFNTTRFSTDMLPMLCGALAVIGSFFKSSLTTKRD